MSKIKELYQKYREIILYLVFGVLTTLVGWGVYFALMLAWKAIFNLPADDSTSAMYITGYTVAQVIQWIAAVLFAFFTNRAWVFTDADRNARIPSQLVKFAGGRVLTFFIDYFVTFLVGLGIAKLIPSLVSVAFMNKTWNLAEIGAKVIAAVIVIVCNYIFSKIFVFTKKKADK